MSQIAANWQVEDQLMRYMAVARLIDHWDDIAALYCMDGNPCANHNYYWYESTVTDRLWLIAWDMDHTLEPEAKHRLRSIGVPEWDDPVVSCEWIPWTGDRYLMPPACDLLIGGLAQGSRELYVTYSQELLEGLFSPMSIADRIASLETLLADEIASDPNGDGLEAWQEAVIELRAVVEEKRARITGRL